METKSKWKSKTVWLAIAQAFAGLLATIILGLKGSFTSPETLTALGVAVKGLVDLKLRFITSKPIA